MILLILTGQVICIMAPMSPMQQEMEQRTGEQEEVRERSEQMGSMFRDEKKSQDREKGA